MTDEPMDRIVTRWQGDDRFEITVRGHRLTVDQPESMGGTDQAPSPTELFVVSLASCVAFYARRYLRRHQLEAEGLTVETSYTMASKPARVQAVNLRIEAPGLPADRREALLAVASHCTVHNSIEQAPEIAITMS